MYVKSKNCRQNVDVKIMTDIYRERERERNRIFGVNGFEFYEVLLDIRNPKNIFYRFFRTRQKQYASARMAVGIKNNNVKVCYINIFQLHYFLGHNHQNILLQVLHLTTFGII